VLLIRRLLNASPPTVTSMFLLTPPLNSTVAPPCAKLPTTEFQLPATPSVWVAPFMASVPLLTVTLPVRFSVHAPWRVARPAPLWVRLLSVSAPRKVTFCVPAPVNDTVPVEVAFAVRADVVQSPPTFTLTAPPLNVPVLTRTAPVIVVFVTP